MKESAIMNYQSTRNAALNLASGEVIVKGISDDGGLFLPVDMPKITLDDLKNLEKLNYMQRANFVLGKFLTDFVADEIADCTKNAYEKSFTTESPAHLEKLDGNTTMLELFHGPTSAFKDMALQILPHLLSTSAKKITPDKTTLILVATSGDTGKAALEGFKDAENIKIAVFYPTDGVSAMQKLQMATQSGENVLVSAIRGNFDDAQNGVKEIFNDKKIKDALESKNVQLSSANSINWGRLVPQIVYYVSAYVDLVKFKTINLGDEINVCVPTGNFGNILAAYYAKMCGVPIGKLICASNRNNVLSEFLKTGVYDKNRELFATASPSMDIVISSNLERLLFELYEKDDAAINGLMKDLSESGQFEVNPQVKSALDEEFFGGYCDDKNAFETIKSTFYEQNYLADTHTAVALNVLNQYRAISGDSTHTIVAATASPFKFSPSVLSALEIPACDDEFMNLELLAKSTKTEIPQNLAEIKGMDVRFSDIGDVGDMPKIVKEFA